MELRKQKIYKTVYEMARDAFIASDYRQQCSRGGLKCTSEGQAAIIEVPYFDETITVRLPRLSFESSKSANVTPITKIMLLHYINNASGVPLSGEKVAYGDIPSCRHYEPVFTKRVLKQLQNAFGYNKYAFLEAGLALGGKKEEFGDASFTLFAFRKYRLPISSGREMKNFPRQPKRSSTPRSPAISRWKILLSSPNSPSHGF
jgi:hypothetical protein